MAELKDPDSRSGDTRSDETLVQAYSYVLALVSGDSEAAVDIQRKYCNDSVRDLLGAVSGVLLGVFGKTSETFRDKVAAGLRFGITGDESFLEAVKAADELPTGQYL